MRIATGALSVVVAIAFVGIGCGKVLATEVFRSQLGLPAWLVVLIGALELAGAVGLLVGLRVRLVGLAAASGLTLLLLGAVGHHVLRGDLLTSGAAAVVLLTLSVILTILLVRTLWAVATPAVVARSAA